MKVLTQKEEERHYNEVLKGGAIGGVVGLALGSLSLGLASRRYSTVRNLTIPGKAFIISSFTTFGLIINSDRASARYKEITNPMYGYKDEASLINEQARSHLTGYDRFMEMGRENRYSIVFGSWLASMGAAFAIVNRSKYMSGAQKLVQARVYAQGLTVAVLVITAVFEMNDAKKGSGRWKTVMVTDPDDANKLIEKKIHKEEYQGQDLWKGEFTGSHPCCASGSVC
ncbi:HIG1 domain-containing protein [Candidatus Bathyarchaeota archaeon]|nr:HIG1 domain-containing protein [Candidatus Bathyarchaeota archaeon]